jgi:hypothetical protein
MTRDHKDGANPNVNVPLNALLGRVAWLSGWPTPHENSTTGAGAQGRDGGLNIQTAAQMAGWPTPDASVAQDGETFETWEARRLKTKERVKNGNGFGTPLTIAGQMAGWPTPRGTDAEKNVRTEEGAIREIERKGSPQDLAQASVVAGWPTPMAGTPAQNGNNEAGNNDSSRKTAALVNWTTTEDGPARLTASGEMLIGSSAGMASGGRLSPEHSLWLMLGNFATVFLNCAERVTRSRSAKPKRLSKH